MLYEHHDERFADLIIGSAELDIIHDESRWAEGPCWFGDGNYLIWSDIPNNRLLRYIPDVGTSVFKSPSAFANGSTRDTQGRLVTCSHGTRSVVRTERDGSVVTLVDAFLGRRLNSPNDVIVSADGAVWFTDPDYGIMSNYDGYRAERELTTCNVFRFDPRDGSLKVVADDFVKPNGLTFNVDQSALYVADSGCSHVKGGPSHIRKFLCDDHGRTTGGEVLTPVECGPPDGIRIDERGNIWSSASDGIHVFSPEGELLGKIRCQGPVSNLEFGGLMRNRLFVTAKKRLYAIYVGVSGKH